MVLQAARSWSGSVLMATSSSRSLILPGGRRGVEPAPAQPVEIQISQPLHRHVGPYSPFSWRLLPLETVRARAGSARHHYHP
jgi:hypothetical protein